MQLSGFKMEVIETAYAGHAKVLSSTVDLKKFPDGNINCVSLFFVFFLFLAIKFLSISLFKMIFSLVYRYYMCWWRWDRQ